MYTWYIGIPLLIKFSRTSNGKGVTGQSVNLTLMRRSDNAYWTGTTWGSVTVLPMTLISDTNNPGEFEYVGPTPTVVDTYECHAYITSGNYACDAYDTILAQPQLSVGSDGKAAITSDPMAELTGMPGATPSFISAIMFLYMKFRNKRTTTDTQQTISNFAGVVIGANTIGDDKTTLTETKFV